MTYDKAVITVSYTHLDVYKRQPLVNTIEYIGSLIDEMERLTDKIEQE